jgi:hypothetical protein
MRIGHENGRGMADAREDGKVVGRHIEDRRRAKTRETSWRAGKVLRLV